MKLVPNMLWKRLNASIHPCSISAARSETYCGVCLIQWFHVLGWTDPHYSWGRSTKTYILPDHQLLQRWLYILTHWSLTKMVHTLQTTFSNIQIPMISFLKIQMNMRQFVLSNGLASNRRQTIFPNNLTNIYTAKWCHFASVSRKLGHHCYRLPKSVLTYFQFDKWKQSSVTFE